LARRHAFNRLGRSRPQLDRLTEAIMPTSYGSNETEHEIVRSTTEARQGVTGHHVRYVLGFGIASVVIVFVIGYLAVRGYFGG
jgi:hypothetical protein